MAIISAVFDTNVIVSGLAYPNSTPGHLLSSWRSGHIRMITCRVILDEVARVLPRLRSNLTMEESRDIADTFLFLAHVVDPIEPDEENLRDSSDAPILGALLASEADWLITGDKDLLALAHKYPIIAPAEFWSRFQ